MVALGERLADQEVQRPGPAPAGHFDEEEATMSFPLFWCCLHQDYVTMNIEDNRSVVCVNYVGITTFES